LRPKDGKVRSNLPTVYVLVADTMDEMHAAMPPGMVRSDHQSTAMPDVVEIWFTRDP
jgi:hypothetical protein